MAVWVGYSWGYMAIFGPSGLISSHRPLLAIIDPIGLTLLNGGWVGGGGGGGAQDPDRF